MMKRMFIKSSVHGTAVLSLMAAFEENVIIGAAPNASYWLFITEDISSETLQEEINWIEAAEFADSVGVDIINTSLGYTTFDSEEEDHSYSELDGNTIPISIAADVAASKGILVVTSAGNSGDRPWTYISAPADGDSVLAIAAVTENRTKASFSSFGPSSDGRIKPDFASFGVDNLIIRGVDDISRGSGTSFASPIYAGLSACLWQAFPYVDNIQIIEKLKETSPNYNNPDTLTGYGITNFCSTLKAFSDEFFQETIFQVYPNPSKGNFNVLINQELYDGTSLIITDLSGKIVYKNRLNRFLRIGVPLNLDISVPNGVYILAVSDNDDVSFSKKIFIVN